MIKFRYLLTFLVILVGLVIVRPVLAQTPSGADQLRALARIAAEGEAAAEQQNLTLIQAEYEEAHDHWETFEDGIRAQNPSAYIEFESALDAVKASLETDPVDAFMVGLAYKHLEVEAITIADKLGDVPLATPAVVEATPADLMKALNTAYQEIEAGETAEAAAALNYVSQAWPSVEGAIATKSPDAYNAIEVDLSRAMAALRTQPADLSSAEAAIERLRESLAPFVGGQTYSMFDAAAIILREGLEALLVIVALMAFLQRSGHNDKRHWIWIGGAVGIGASLVVAVALNVVFNYAASGQNREVVEGVTGLVAAGLLFYVSYWLHSKASIHGWQSYIKTRTNQALAGGSLVGLALLAFLAVFREGAETAIFYLGMASAISLQDLVLGLSIGIGILAVAAILMFKVGVKLPLRPFFLVAGLLVYYLGFKFLGAGIHALQVSGVLPASPVDWLPAVPLLGVFPTWETMIPQLVLLLGAVVVWLYLRLQDRQAQAATLSVSN
ncbi:MAG: FTR1 family protein [Anaerolineales bacterium]|nr:FTR1 family protein [Anaerolineales bacterium]